MNRDRVTMAITVSLMIFIILFLTTICIKVMIAHDFKKVEAKMYTDVEFVPETKLMERPYYILLFPWSQYHKHSTRELSSDETAFLKEKKAAECIIDMVNYDETLIQDRDNAVSLLYNNVRRLITDDDREYYVWNEIPIEDIYIYTMVNMKGEIFSFRYATTTEYDGQEAIDYVMESYENGDFLSYDEVMGDCDKNKTRFIENTYLKLSEYRNLNTKIFYKNIDFYQKPTQISQEKGSVLIEYKIESEDNKFVFLYFDSKTKKFSGYHLMLY